MSNKSHTIRSMVATSDGPLGTYKKGSGKIENKNDNIKP